MQDETIIIQALSFGVACIRDFIVYTYMYIEL